MSALNSEEMERARRANPLPLDASWSTGDEAFDARIHASLMQRDEARDALEEMRLRAEGAEARIASVSGVTREELAKREYERGIAEGKTLRDVMSDKLVGVLEAQRDHYAKCLADLSIEFASLQRETAVVQTALTFARSDAASQLDAFADALADLYVAWCALQTQHAEQYEALRAEIQGDVTLLREALEEIAGTYDDGTPAQIIAEDALAALGEP